MAAQPSVESILGNITRAAIQLNNAVAEGQSILKHHTLFMNQVRTYLERRDSPHEQRPNDKNVTPLLYSLENYTASLSLAGRKIAHHEERLRVPVQQWRDDLNRLDSGRDVHSCHNTLLYGAANDGPIFGGRGNQPNRDSTPYDAADEQMASGQRKHCPNGSALPKPEETIIPDNERCGHTHGQGSGHDRHPLISNCGPGSFLDTYHNLQDIPFRRGLDRVLDTSHYDVKSLGHQVTRDPKARQDLMNDYDLAMASVPHHRDSESANVRAPWHHSTDDPVTDGSKVYAFDPAYWEAEAFPALEPRSSRHPTLLEVSNLLKAPTTAEAGHRDSLAKAQQKRDLKKRRLEQMRALLRAQHAATPGNIKRKADHLGTWPDPRLPVRNPFYGAQQVDFDYPTLPWGPVQQVDDLNRPPSSDALCAALDKAVIDQSLHNKKHAQGPVVNAKRSNTTPDKSGVTAITDTKNDDENVILSSHFSSDSSESSSESGFNTPDSEKNSGAGGEVKDDAVVQGWADMEWDREDGKWETITRGGARRFETW